MNDELTQHIQILQGVTSPDKKIIQATYDYISSTPPQKLVELTCKTILLNENVPIVSVQLSFIIFNRIKFFMKSNWDKFTLQQRDMIKEALIRGILSPDVTNRNFASVVFACVVEADKHLGISLHILELVSSYIKNADIPNQNKIGFIFTLKELIQQNVISPSIPDYVNSYVVFIQYLLYILMNPREFPKPVFLDIIACYTTILPFYEKPLIESNIKQNFLQLIQNNLDSEPDPLLHERLYQLLFSYVKTCYSIIIEDMKQIFQISQISFTKKDVNLVVPSIHFWNEVANYEYQLMKEKERNIKLAKNDETVIKNITLTVSQVLIPPIVDFIIQTANEKPPDENTGELNICHDAAEALLSFGRLSPFVFQYVSQNFNQMKVSDNWKVRHASIILLYCITESPNIHDQVKFFEANFNEIVVMVNDRSYAANDATLWVIELIFNKYQLIAINENYLNTLLSIINNAPFAPIILATRICDIVNKIGKNFEGIKDNSPPYEKIYPNIIDSMLKTLEREDAPNTILGAHCAEALSSLILAAPRTFEPGIIQILHQIIDRIKAENARHDIVPREFIQMKLQFYCTLIWASVKRLKKQIEPFSESLLQTLLDLLSRKMSICQQEGLLALSALINVLGNILQPYVPQIVQIFIISQESQMKEIVEMSSSVVLCLFQTLGMFMAADEERNKKIFNICIQNLQNENLDISAKIQILFAMAEMIRVLKSAISNAYPVFVSQLTNFQNSLYNLQLDRENTCMLCMALLKGYSSLIESAAKSDYIEIIISNYKQITRLFELMSKFKANMTDGLKAAIIDFLTVVLNNIATKVNVQLHKRCVRSIVEQITIDSDMALALRASTVLKRIHQC